MLAGLLATAAIFNHPLLAVSVVSGSSEFIFRDAKQFTGLGHCQARGQASLDFHFNASLTALNLAKMDAYLSFGYNPETPFSMATQKMVYFNEHLLYLLNNSG